MTNASTSDTVARFAELAAAARLDGDAAQRVFRALLDSLSHPGRPQTCPVPPGVPAALVPLLALCDVETSVAVVESGREAPTDWEAVVVAVTGARRAPVAEAGWVAALDAPSALTALAASGGTAAAPEAAARLVLAVDDLSETPRDGSITLVMSGPGIPGSRRLSVSGPAAEVFTRIDRANQAFPAGLDTWLVAPDGTLVGLPRSVDLIVAASGGR